MKELKDLWMKKHDIIQKMSQDELIKEAREKNVYYEDEACSLRIKANASYETYEKIYCCASYSSYLFEKLIFYR